MGFFSIFKRKRKRKIEVNFKAFDVINSKAGKYDYFYKQLLRKSLIMLITGKRGSGKTSLGMKFLELFTKLTKKKCYAVGFSKSKIPRWIKKVEDTEKIKNNSVALLDEGALLFSSREAMKQPNKIISKIMAIARHKNLTLILIAQNSAMIDLNVLRLADVILLKEPSLLQTKFERKAIKEMYEKVIPLFKDIKETEKKKYVYLWSDEFEGLLRYDLPEFWNESISKGFRYFK